MALDRWVSIIAAEGLEAFQCQGVQGCKGFGFPKLGTTPQTPLARSSLTSASWKGGLKAKEAPRFFPAAATGLRTSRASFRDIVSAAWLAGASPPMGPSYADSFLQPSVPGAFQGSQRFGRCHEHVCRVWGALQIATSTAWLLRCKGNKHARLVGQCMSPAHRDLFWDRAALVTAGGLTLIHHAARDFIALQSRAMWPASDMDSAVTYAWIGYNGIYFGKANQRRQRRPTFSGVCTRWFEHECLRFKKHLPGAEFYRYTVARKAAASARSFMIIRQGSSESMLVYESLIIIMLSPNMNA